MQQRITDLEIKLAYQEQTIEELNQALIQQELALQKIQRAYSELIRRVDSIQAPSESGAIPSAADERPPHY